MWIVLALALAAPLHAASRQKMGRILDKVYKGHDMAQRTFYGGAKVRYRSNGQAIHAGKPGAWTLDAEVLCKQLTVKHRKVVIEGRRLYFLYKKRRKRLVPYLGPKVEIDIATGKAPVTLSLLQSEIAKVFVTGNENSLLFIPDYWKNYLLRQAAEPPKPAKPKIVAVPLAAITGLLNGAAKPSQPTPKPLKPLPTPQKKENGKVTAPVPTHVPEPPYTGQARVAKIEGNVLLAMIVNAAGKVTRVSIVRPVGMGLDDSAAQTVKKWRFKPATRNGKPVAVKVKVEVAFKLY